MSASPKILIVDDEPEILEMLKMALETASYEVMTASNGKEGIEMIEKEKPDAILMDLMMPEMDGFKAISKLKADPLYDKVPILLLTAANSDSASYTRYAKSLGLEFKPEDCLSKPIDPNVLLDRLSKELKS